MNFSITKKLLLGTTVALGAVTAVLTPALARDRHNHHGHRHFWRAPVYVTPVYGGCDYYYRKWKHTGSRYWKSKYFHCIH